MSARPIFPLEFKLLLALLKASLDGEGLGDCRALLRGRTVDWTRFERLLIEHRVVSIVYDALAGLRESLPEDFWNRYTRLNRSLQLRQLRKVQELLEIVRIFDAHEIRFLTLKGPAVSQLLYGDPAKRHCNDLDLIVLWEDFPKIQAAMETVDYRREGEAFDDRMSKGESCERLSHHEHYQRGESQVEIHWRLSSLDFMVSDSVSKLYERRGSVTIGGLEVPMLAEADLVDYLTLHGTAHCWHRLKWLFDIAKANRSEIGDGRQIGLRRAAGLRDRLLEDLLGIGNPNRRLSFRFERLLSRISVSQILEERLGPDSPKKVLGRTFCVCACAIGIGRKFSYLLTLFSWPEFYRRFPLPRKLRGLYCVLGPLYWIYRKIVDRFSVSRVSSK